jgi:hypothetical protein
MSHYLLSVAAGVEYRYLVAGTSAPLRQILLPCCTPRQQNKSRVAQRGFLGKMMAMMKHQPRTGRGRQL